MQGKSFQSEILSIGHFLVISMKILLKSISIYMNYLFLGQPYLYSVWEALEPLIMETVAEQPILANHE